MSTGTTTTTTESTTTTPNPYSLVPKVIKADNEWFMISSKIGMNQDNSRFICEKYGLALAVFNSSSQYSYVSNLFNIHVLTWIDIIWDPVSQNYYWHSVSSSNLVTQSQLPPGLTSIDGQICFNYDCPPSCLYQNKQKGVFMQTLSFSRFLMMCDFSSNKDEIYVLCYNKNNIANVVELPITEAPMTTASTIYQTTTYGPSVDYYFRNKQFVDNRWFLIGSYSCANGIEYSMASTVCGLFNLTWANSFTRNQSYYLMELFQPKMYEVINL
jgi:hypothetical protein